MLMFKILGDRKIFAIVSSILCIVSDFGQSWLWASVQYFLHSKTWSTPMQKILGLVAFAVVSLTLPQLALAQSSSQGETWSTKHAQVKNQLEQAGYKDVRIIPLSYLVQATDKAGNPAMMVITPTSMTAITDMGSPMGKGILNTQ
jgi:hypothetical protein